MQFKTNKETFWGIIAGFFVFWFLTMTACYLLRNKVFKNLLLDNWINYFGAAIGLVICILMIILIKKNLRSHHSE